MSDRPYITERTKTWRARDIKPWFHEAIDLIEKHGCQIMSVSADDVAPTFSYTTGVYDNCGKPEIITVGLYPKTAHSALNEAVRRLRSGVDLALGRHRNIIGNVDVEFRPVQPKWLHHVMLRTHWFYEDEELHDLPLGWYAVREKPGAPWERHQREPEEEEPAPSVN
jgi:hypothetical protein